MQVFQKRKDGVWRNAISAGLTGEERGFSYHHSGKVLIHRAFHSRPLLIFRVVDGHSG